MPASDVVLIVTTLGAFIAVVGAVCVRIITAHGNQIHEDLKAVKSETETIATKVDGTATEAQKEIRELRAEVARNLITAAEFKQLAALLAQAKEKQ